MTGPHGLATRTSRAHDPSPTRPLGGTGGRRADGNRSLRALRDSSLARFVAAGAANNLVNFVLFHAFLTLFRAVPGAPGLAQATTYAIVVVLSFAVNRRWTFRSAGPVHGEARRFALAHLGSLAASSLLIQVGVEQLGLSTNACWLLAVAVTTVSNYALQRFWVFRRRRGRGAL